LQRLVNIYRGDELESFHTGSIAVVDSMGRLLAFAGSPHHAAFLRSATKPFQLLPLLQGGGRNAYDLTPEEIALACGSHGGEPKHVATAASLLRKGDFDESDLQCGIHQPFDEKAAADLRQTGELPTVLHNNCSGKHAAMLLAAQLSDSPTTNYLDSDHPIQRRMFETLADFAEVPPDEILHAVDGCGAPSFCLTLFRSAYAYARLAATSVGASAAGALPRYADNARDVFTTMTSHPDYVAGNWSITTPLMQSFGNELLAKEGAEGFYAMALLPSLSEILSERLPRSDGASIGIALKIHDGSMSRGRNPVILRVLELLGLDLSKRPLLQELREKPMMNFAGKEVGKIRAEFELNYL